MKYLLILISAFQLFSVSAFAQSTNRITVKLEVITATSNKFSLTGNGDTRTFTNSVTDSATQIATNHTVAGSASNLYNHLVSSPFARVNVTGYTNGSNVIYLRGDLGVAMSFSALSNWVTISYSTQVFSSGTIDVRVPIDSEQPAVRTNVASQLAYAAKYSSNAIPEGTVAYGNFVQRGSHQITSNKFNVGVTNTGGVNTNMLTTNSTFGAGTLAGRITVTEALVGGSYTNAGVTNSTIGGGAFAGAITSSARITGGTYADITVSNMSSPGTGLNSFQVGASAVASGDFSITVGDTAIASGTYAIASGLNSLAAEDFAVSLGNEAVVNVGATAGLALGSAVTANGAYSRAFGNSSAADHDYSWVFGDGISSTAAHQFLFGDADDHVRIPGEVRDLKLTNVWSTGTNRFDLAVAFSRTNITSLANGVNLVDPGLKTYLKVSGPSAGYSIDKITRGWDGRILRIQKTDSLTLTIANESGSGGGAATDRILTGTGANVTITNNPGFVELIYDLDAGRWGVSSKSN